MSDHREAIEQASARADEARELTTEQASSSAPWWSRSLSRRDVNKAGLGAALVLSAQSVGFVGCSKKEAPEAETEKIEEKDALAAQQSGGWNVGYKDTALTYANPTPSIDAAGQGATTTIRELSGDNTPKLLALLKPTHSAWEPFQKLTLAQALKETSLTTAIKLVNGPRTQAAFDRGAALASLITNSQNAHQTLLIVDLPGPEAVALAAGMADQVEPVFYLDNWPHPKGVVPSHETLGALLYHASTFKDAVAKRAIAPTPAPPSEDAPAPEDAGRTATADAALTPPPAGANGEPRPVPMALILDRNRLNAYTSEATQFDNRYVADIPSAAKLKELGIARVLYVRPGAEDLELDDLNDALVEVTGVEGLEVSSVPLEAFEKDEDAPADSKTRGYYYGGDHRSHTHFYNHYPMYPYYPMGGFVWIHYSSPRASAPRTRSARASSYKPSRRSTMFSSSTTGGRRGVGRTRPAGFGRVSTRVNSRGQVTGTRHGSTRSGSYGRSSGRSGS